MTDLVFASTVSMGCWIHGVDVDPAEVDLSFNFRNAAFSLGIYLLINTVCFECLIVCIQASYI